MKETAPLNTPSNIPLSLAVSPSGDLYVYSDQQGEEWVSAEIAEKINDLFVVNSSIGLLCLGVIKFTSSLPPSFVFWQKFSSLFITEVCKLFGSEKFSSEKLSHLVPPSLHELELFLEEAPFMRGAEYLNVERLRILWDELSQALLQELIPFNGQIQDYLAAFNPTWNKIGKVCFHLAENKADATHPFAFLATYTARLSETDTITHLPLGRALNEYSGDKRSNLLSLLLPVQKATEQSPFIKDLVDTGAIFQPLVWGVKEAHAFLKTIPQMEAAGVMVRVPNWWNPKKPPRPQITIAVGNANASAVGLDALLDFNMGFSLPDGETLTVQELEELMKAQGQLVQIKGQWVEVDQDKLNHVLDHWKVVERHVKREGLSFGEGLRLLAGAPGQETQEVPVEDIAEWSKVVEGPWLNDVLTRLRHPDQSDCHDTQSILQKYLLTDLRPYQLSGVQWLWWLYNLRLGGCLADDMGLGKTIQVLSLLLLTKHMSSQKDKGPNLLILPASLLGNWKAEILKFAPDLKVRVAHGSVANGEKGKLNDIPTLQNIDLVITTYAMVTRLPWLSKLSWNIVVLDEAQSIKNPAAKQTQAIKKLISQVRFVLTGTPVENRLLDLWSLFDFVAPGLLGSSKAFSNYGKQIQNLSADQGGEGRFYAAVRHLVSPYILRRLKSDKRIIADLPDKTEVKAYCPLTKQQVGLYQRALHELEARLEQEVDGIQRRGLVLSYLTRFKQICNHPSQWLGHGQYAEQDSGKFIRLKEICEEIALKQEKVLVFTQFREIIPALNEFLTHIFGQEGLTLHGRTSIKNRPQLVEAFQQERKFPFFILSLKAGGTGLNLTNAAHVIHFDRWWNPAVENQATDRAYRIGQKKNVLVHKFICQGTIEEKIDGLISAKSDLSAELLSPSGEVSLTELDNAELLKIVSLDIHRALGET